MGPPKATSTLILGAGLAGLSTAYHLGRRPYAAVERENRVGGTARSLSSDGFTFDFTGHLLHLHHDDTRRLIAGLLGNNFYRCRRDTRIFSHNTLTRYPFQANTHGLPSPVVDACVLGFVEEHLPLAPVAARPNRNFLEWCLRTFGEGVTRHFMRPYNEKLFQTRAEKMTADWCGPFVPVPKLEDVLEGALIGTPRAFGYNARFLYPKKGGIQVLSEALGKKVPHLHLSTAVTRIDWHRRRAHFSTGHSTGYRALVNTMPLPVLLRLMRPLPAAVEAARRRLAHVGIVCINLGVNRARISPASWIYFPEDAFLFYRVGFPMNFTPHVVPPGASSMYVEVPENRATLSGPALLKRVRQDLIRCGILRSDDRFLTVQMIPIPHAYVVYDHHRDGALRTIFSFLKTQNVQSIGRYGGWKYSFMEEAIRDGKQAAERVLRRGG